MLSLCQSGKLKLESYSHQFANPIQALTIFQTLKNDQITEFIFKEYDRILEEKGMEAAYRWSSFLFAGFSITEFREISLSVWKEFNDSGKIFPFREMLELISYLQKNNWDTYIVTASPVQAIRTVSHLFSISEANVIGMELKIQDEIMTSTILEPYTYGEGKVQALFKFTGKKADLAFGDSINDLPLLTSATKGILLDRGKYPNLVESCKEKNISIYPIFI